MKGGCQGKACSLAHRYKHTTILQQMLSGLFERCMKRRGIKESDPFDWEKTPTDNSLGTTTTTTHAVITKPQHADR